MALNAKFLAAAATIGGCGIAIPVYLKSGSVSEASQKSSFQTSPKNLERDNPKSRSIEQVSCHVSDISSERQQLKNSLREKQHNLSLYNLVSCTNPNVKKSEDSYFGKNWEGLFPTSALSEKLFFRQGQKFALNATTAKVEEDNSDNEITFTTFSNMQTGDSIRGKWTDIVNTSFPKKRAVVITIEGKNQFPNNIYIFVDSRD